jgi:hypothetical protein
MINMSMTLMNELNFNNCYNMRLATSHFNKETKYKYEGLTDLSIKK